MIPPELTRVFATREVYTPNGEVRPLSSAIPEGCANALYETVRARSPRAVLEIGMAYGISTLAIASALDDVGSGLLTSLDPYQASRCENIGLETIRRADLSHRHALIEEPDYEALPRLLSEGRRFELTYIDGNHTFEYTLLDLFYADKLTPVGGVIAINDCGFAAVAKALRWFTTHRRYQELDVGLPTRVRPPIYDAPNKTRAALAPMLRAVGKYAPRFASEFKLVRFEDRYFEKIEDWEPSWDFFAQF
jgi:predicted O-methyltransferase YrrM